MSHRIKWTAPLAALSLLTILSLGIVIADDSATTRPGETTGTITIKVVGADKKPAAAVMITLSSVDPATQPSTNPTADASPPGASPSDASPADATATPAPKAGSRRRARGVKAAPATAAGQTDADGSITFKDIPLGDYTILALSSSQPAERGRGKVTLGPDGTANVKISLRARKNAAAAGGTGTGQGQGGGGNNGGSGG
jgi:hypothetical protein